MTRNEKSGAAALPVPPVTGTSADMLFRKAGPGDCARAQEIIRLARERMGRQGNPQWQDGYPADEDVRHDIEAGNGYVLCLHNRPVVYGAILFDEEPAYGPIEGRWLNDRPYAVVHRLAVHLIGNQGGLRVAAQERVDVQPAGRLAFRGSHPVVDGRLVQLGHDLRRGAGAFTLHAELAEQAVVDIIRKGDLIADLLGDSAAQTGQRKNDCQNERQVLGKLFHPSSPSFVPLTRGSVRWFLKKTVFPKNF